jgi:hypothetical protein
MMRLGAVGAVVFVAACTAADDAGSPIEELSNTPRITLNEGGSLSASLLTERDVRLITGLEDAVAQDLNEIPFFENPDPRGPCGGVVPQLPLTDAVGRAFSGAEIMVVQFLAPPSAEAREYVAAAQADRTTPCESFTSLTNVGTTQLVRDVEFIDLGDLAADGIAWTAVVEVGTYVQSIGGGVLMIDDRLLTIQASSLAPIDAATVRSLLEAAVSRLGAPA